MVVFTQAILHQAVLVDPALLPTQQARPPDTQYSAGIVSGSSNNDSIKTIVIMKCARSYYRSTPVTGRVGAWSSGVNMHIDEH